MGGGLAVIVLMTSATILLCVVRRCRQRTKGNSVIADDIQMTQNDLYTIAAKVQQHSDSTSYHGVTSQKAAVRGGQQTSTPNNMYTDVCDNTYENVINN